MMRGANGPTKTDVGQLVGPVDGAQGGSDSGKAPVACDAGVVTISSRPDPAYNQRPRAR